MNVVLQAENSVSEPVAGLQFADQSIDLPFVQDVHAIHSSYPKKIGGRSTSLARRLVLLVLHSEKNLTKGIR